MSCVRLAIVSTLRDLYDKYPSADLFCNEVAQTLLLFKNDPSREIRLRSSIEKDECESLQREESGQAGDAQVRDVVDPTTLRFIEAELENEGADDSANLSLIELSQAPSNFTDVLKRAVGSSTSAPNSFLTQLMKAFEEKDQEVHQEEEKASHEEQSEE